MEAPEGQEGMSFEGTIAEVRLLLAKRDEIDGRLSELMSGGAKTIAPKVPTASKSGRKQNACSGCGKPGHRVTTCEKAKASDQRIRDRFADDEEETTGEVTEELPANSPVQKGRINRITELLKSGHDDDFIAVEANTSPRVVRFYRRQMVDAGRLS